MKTKASKQHGTDRHDLLYKPNSIDNILQYELSYLACKVHDLRKIELVTVARRTERGIPSAVRFR